MIDIEKLAEEYFNEQDYEDLWTIDEYDLYSDNDGNYPMYLGYYDYFDKWHLEKLTDGNIKD